MRKYQDSQYEKPGLIRDSLEVLANKTTNEKEYRSAFETLGKELGKILARTMGDIPTTEIMLVCASEDADWLAKGVEAGFNRGKLPISVYWSTRLTIYESEEGEKVEISPIVKAYEEQIDKCRLLVIVKSIISSSCVVKTQLTRLIDHVNPEIIAIMAPVMYITSKDNLKKAFPEDISKKFQFLTFAVDDQQEGSEIIPGVGGMVYQRLGLGDINLKNKYIPDMVKARM